ncbi:MAG: type II toxin-antitoxin system VapC family toxin [Gammaproteobacteria bacterium]|nr:type II toxin-antitoxin system VapC family toxin [Gammaproteobacteria bacterium]
MRLLLDTHVLLWWLADDRRLVRRTRQIIADPNNAIFVSAASIWEIAIKAGLGRLKVDVDVLASGLEANGLMSLPIAAAHAAAVFHLPLLHRDPFDRMLIAQALTEKLQLVTRDPQFAEYDVECIAI